MGCEWDVKHSMRSVRWSLFLANTTRVVQSTDPNARNLQWNEEVTFVLILQQ